MIEIPSGRIDEAFKAMPDTGGKDLAALLEKRRTLETNRSERKEDNSRLSQEMKNGDAALSAAVADLKTRMAEAKAQYAEAVYKQYDGVYKEIAEVKKSLSACEDELRRACASIAETESKHRQMQEGREKLLHQYKEVSHTAWEEASAICPTCHRPLPPDEVERLRSGFNRSKSERLEEINRAGKESTSKEMIAALAQTLSTQRDRLDALKLDKSGLETRIKGLEDKLADVTPFTQTDEYKARYAEIEALSQGGSGKRAEEIGKKMQANDGEISKLNEEIEAISTVIFSFEVCDRQKARIAQLNEEEKKLSAEFEQAEHGIYLCELFTKTKVSSMNDRINERFKTVRFQLFQEQINGGLKECCDVLVPSPTGAMVPFDRANHAARINAGLEIIGVLSEHYGAELPVFVDNAESVSRLITIPAQRIRLIVSASDTELRMECETNE